MQREGNAQRLQSMFYFGSDVLLGGLVVEFCLLAADTTLTRVHRTLYDLREAIIHGPGLVI